MATEPSICVLTGERPIDAASFGVALALPRVDLASRGLSIHQPPPEALTLQDADLDLRHVQPAGMLGRVVKLHAPQQRSGRRATQHLLETGTKVGVEVVQNQMDRPGG